MPTIVRTDLTRVFAAWIAVASFLWLATPWMASWSVWLGSAWVWCAALPAGALALAFPGQTVALVAAIAGGLLAGLAGGVRTALMAATRGGPRRA